MASDASVASLQLHCSLERLVTSKKSGLLLVGGTNAIQTLELVPPNEDESGFRFEPKRRFASAITTDRSTRAKVRGVTRTSGLAFFPETDECAHRAASCTSQGSILLWDLQAPQGRRPLIAQWEVDTFSAANCIAFLSTAEPLLMSSSLQGALTMWKVGEYLEALDRLADEDGAGASEGPQHTRVPHVEFTKSQANNRVSTDLHSQSIGNSSQLLAFHQDGQASLYTLDGASYNRPRILTVSSNFRSLVSGRFHPHNPDLFAAAAIDFNIYVVDTRCQDDRTAGVTTMRTHCNNSITGLRWRPDNPFQLATSVVSGDKTESGITVWDLRQPFLPLHKFPMTSPATDFQWADSNHILCCTGGQGRDPQGTKGGVHLLGVHQSVQPLKATCCAAATWTFSTDGRDSVGMLTSRVPREAEKDGAAHASESLKDALTYCRGFEREVNLSGEATREARSITQALRERPKGLRVCHVLTEAGTARGPPGVARELVALLRVARRCEPGLPKGSLAGLCLELAERCGALPPRHAQTWRFLAQLAGDDAPAQLMEQAILSSKSVRAGDADDSSPMAARGVGAGRFPDSRRGSFASSQPASDSAGSVFEPPQRLSAVTEVSGVGPAVGVSVDQERRMDEHIQQWRKTWLAELLRDIVAHHEERNDVGVLLLLIAVLGVRPDHETGVNPIITRKLLRWTRGAATVLTRVKAYVPRAELLRASELPEVQKLSQNNVVMSSRCLHCKATFPPARGLHAIHKKTYRQDGGKELTTWQKHSKLRCPNGQCKQRRTPPCAICGEDVKGLLVSCQTCGHGGHLSHMRAWFAAGNVGCPAGCGHRCHVPSL